MRIAVLGAGGTIAPAIVRDLAESGEVERMLLLDLDGERAAAVAREQGGGRAEARQVDAGAGLASHLDGCDALVNSASYRVNLEAMRACLDARCHYLDLGGLYWLAAKQLELNDEFERARLLAVLGIGSSPGKTNLLAKRAVAEITPPTSSASPPVSAGDGSTGLGSWSDLSLHVSASGRDEDPPAGFSVPYALRTLLDELTMAPVVIRDGEPVEVEPLSDGGEVDFGEPLGVRPTIRTIHSEMLTFPDSFGCRQASFRLALAPELLERLRKLTDTSDEEVERAAASAARPSAKTLAVHLVEAAGDGRTVRARAVTGPHAEWGLGGGIVSTASPIAAAVRLLARGRIEARGALPPERCLDPEEMFAELETRGTRFELDVAEGVVG